MNQFEILLRALTTYYIVGSTSDGTVIANQYTHQLYHVRYLKDDTTMVEFDYEPEFVFIPLMVKYEELFSTPIETLRIWDGDISSL